MVCSLGGCDLFIPEGVFSSKSVGNVGNCWTVELVA